MVKCGLEFLTAGSAVLKRPLWQLYCCIMKNNLFELVHPRRRVAIAGPPPQGRRRRAAAAGLPCEPFVNYCVIFYLNLIKCDAINSRKLLQHCQLF